MWRRPWRRCSEPIFRKTAANEPTTEAESTSSIELTGVPVHAFDASWFRSTSRDSPGRGERLQNDQRDPAHLPGVDVFAEKPGGKQRDPHVRKRIDRPENREFAAAQREDQQQRIAGVKRIAEHQRQVRQQRQSEIHKRAEMCRIDLRIVDAPRPSSAESGLPTRTACSRSPCRWTFVSAGPLDRGRNLLRNSSYGDLQDNSRVAATIGCRGQRKIRYRRKYRRRRRAPNTDPKEEEGEGAGTAPRLYRRVDGHDHPASLRHHDAGAGFRDPHRVDGRHAAGGRPPAGG